MRELGEGWSVAKAGLFESLPWSLLAATHSAVRLANPKSNVRCRFGGTSCSIVVQKVKCNRLID